MGKAVSITVIGTQTDTESKEKIQTNAKGEIFKKGETFYIVYDQKDEDSLQLIHHRIKLKGQSVELHRNGAGQQSRMQFEEGKSFTSSYILSGMALALTIQTKRVDIIKNEQLWKIVLEYELLLEGQHASDNRTEVWVEN